MQTKNSVFLPDGRSAAVLGVFPRMNAAVVKMADGRVQTVALSELGLQATADGGSPRERRPGKGNIAAGTPHEALASDPTLQKMQPRIREETGSNDPVTFVVEAMHDIWANEATELSPEEQSVVAERYWDELANKVGIQQLRNMPKLWHYFQHLAQHEYNLTIDEVMNGRAYQAIQRVIARRTRTENQTVQGADQPTYPRIPLQHRGRQEVQGDSGKSEESEGESGSGPDEIERPLSTSQSVFLPDGRKATIQYISPAMKVARVRTADGQTRTLRLSEIQQPQPPSSLSAAKAPNGQVSASSGSLLRKLVKT